MALSLAERHLVTHVPELASLRIYDRLRKFDGAASYFWHVEVQQTN